jgi:hypothetical protein
MRPGHVGAVFIGLSVVFLAAAVRDRLRKEAGPSPARTTWLRIAIIFAAVGIGLQLLG